MPAKRTSAASKNRKETSVGVPDGMRRTFTWLLLLLALGAIGYVFVLNSAAMGGGLVALPTVPVPLVDGIAPASAQILPAAAIAAEETPSVNIDRRIGIVAGHRGNDSGTVCADGLTEAAVNLDHATRAADLLRAEGFNVEILDEKDVRLKNYEALAYISIHADSCAKINELATGYKVARSIHSAIPEIEDRLVACMTSRYARATNLRFHRNTVTHNMTEYHGFYKIGAKTPSAIIETGFMYADREVLTKNADKVAQGIAEGVLCFIREQEP
jgi:N-acetylmuramoyl-L-alanine amidase